ncbi:MAG: response regulator transcription factor [Elusimicrobiales bacterium]|nr:response regulator transcription factor [Elusimicrobiales bacterium]
MTEDKQKKIRVFLVDDHPIVREGVRAYLTSRAISVVGEASDAKETLRKVKKLAPDVIVVDVNLPLMDGGELSRRLRRLVPKSRIIAFSIHSSEEYVVKMARCGVRGYVVKDQPTSELLDAIRQVSQGGLHFPAGMTDAILAPAAKAAQAEPGTVPLTGRELEVVSLLAEGFSNKGVAARLGIGVRTAETHREHISHKLHIPTVAGLTKYAIQHGLTSLK